MPSLRRSRAKRPADGSMSLMEHLYELRTRLFWAVLSLFLGTVVGFIWFANGIPALGIKPLGDILIAPYCAVPSPPRVDIYGNATECQLLATTPFSVLTLRLKAALMAGAVLSCPFWLYQLWAFVTPALYSKEKKFAVIFVASSAVLFAGGAVLAYAVISEGLKVLLGFGGDTAAAALTPESYYSFLMALLLIFGVSFELPLLLVMLNMVGVVSGKRLAKARRYAFFGLFVFAALVVPGNDPITMSALAVALCLLYELAVQIAKLHDRRKAKRLAAEGLETGLEDFDELSDDEASPLRSPSRAGASTGGAGVAAGGFDASPGGVDAPTPVSEPAPIEAPEPTPEPRLRRRDDAGFDLGDAT